ncbi:MAG: phospholipase A2 [bacterium]|nr:phospholipase A2 [bacterium]
MRKLILGLVTLLVVIAAVSFASPAQPAEAANGCGPSALSLYVIIPDNIYYFHVTRWQTERFNFTGACNNHDNCYDSSGISRATCDQRFYNDMLAVCNRGWTSTSRAWCRGWAWTYYQSVRTFGGPAYTA